MSPFIGGGSITKLATEGRLIFGLGRLHHLATAAARQKLLAKALEHGFRTFDVAPAYGNGLAEIELGLALRASGLRARVMTKAGIPVRMYPKGARHCFPPFRVLDRLFCGGSRAYRLRDFRPQHLIESLEGSLRRLHLDAVETLYLHEPIAPFEASERSGAVDFFLSMLSRGKIHSWGVAGPRATYARPGEAEIGDRIQLPLEEWRSGPPVAVPATVYGVFDAYRQAASRTSFAEFLGGMAAQDPTTRFILATTKVDTLRQWFCEEPAP